MALSFPANPTNGQKATVGGILYSYSTATQTWDKTAGTTPDRVAFSTTWDAKGYKSMGDYTLTGPLALVSDATSSFDGFSTHATLVANGTNIPTFDGITAPSWVNTNGARQPAVFFRLGDTHYWMVGSTVLTVIPNYAPINTLPTVVTAVSGQAFVFTGASVDAKPTTTPVFSWRTSAGVLVQDNVTSGSYTPPAAGSFILRMTSTNSSGTDTDDLAVTVTAAATAPAAPTVSAATSITATGLSYTWADGGNGGSAITARNADISFDSGTSWSAITTPVVGSNSITFASSGSARTAQIRGRATNAVGPGSYGTLTGISVPAASSGAPTITSQLRVDPTGIDVPSSVTESGSYAAGYDYLTSATGSGGGSLYKWRDETNAPNVFAIGNRRFIIHVTSAVNPVYALLMKLNGASVGFYINVGGGLPVFTGGSSSEVALNSLPADSGQTGVVVRGADWATAPTMTTTIYRDHYISLIAVGTKVSYCWWDGTVWKEWGVLRPTTTIGAGFESQQYNNSFNSGNAATFRLSMSTT